MDPHFFSHLLLDRQKVEYLCSFREAVPRFVICHLLQPVVCLLLMLVAAAAAAVFVFVFVVAAAVVFVFVVAAAAAAFLVVIVPYLPQIRLQYH